MKRLLSTVICCCSMAVSVFLFGAVPARRAVKPAVRPPAKKAAPAAAKGKPAATAKAAPVKPTPEAIAAKWLAGMTPRERVAQLIVAPFNGFPARTRVKEYRTLLRLVQKEHIGGLILINVVNGRVAVKPGPKDVATFVNRMQGLSKVPLIVGGDLERGASMRVDSTTVFPHAMAFTASRDPDTARIEGRITAQEARAMGIHWIFYPDADVNNNPDNPIINIRSFGENPSDVAAMVSAFIEGAHSGAPVLVTAKHFPGHGDTATDTHMNMATIDGSRERLEMLEWPPFRAAIKSGVDSIMSAHISVPSVDPTGSPATLSNRLISGILRDEMGFRGLVVSDALEMRGIQNDFSAAEAAVRAVEAGVDVLLMPPNAEAALDGVMEAIRSGRIAQERIDRSALRILEAKARLNLDTGKLVNVAKIPAAVNTKQSIDAAQHISDRSVTLVRNNGNPLPIRNPGKTAFFVLGESARNPEGKTMAAEIKLRATGSGVELFHQDMSYSELMAAADRAQDADQYVIAAFASVSAYRGNVALAGSYPDFVQKLLATKKPVILIAMGNPYLLRSFPEAAAYLTTYSTVAPSEVSAVRALFGEIPVTGKLPVSIPGQAAYMDGISLPGPAARASR